MTETRNYKQMKPVSTFEKFNKSILSVFESLWQIFLLRYYSNKVGLVIVNITPKN